MAIIKKKITPEYYKLIKSGKKRFETRVADFKVKEGDTLVLVEYDPDTEQLTGRKIEKKVGYFLHFDLNKFGQKDLIEKHGLYIIQLID